ncbi:hypothetical protein [Pseudomonas sp. 9Ag]|uniref:hypothetical protein n=1 Tax=Pseudomonas sp. 9Ag TaxID=2653167 RepID=UPI0012F4045C|nr:hypothetical protein [Pseudomonas sp. 9Ag]VXC65656.1 hypothetical protein PSEUDO9AG_40612 [Pseudomonas sp. 9Ag]
MYYAVRISLLHLLGIIALLAGCANVPYSFRIEPAEELIDRVILPPGAEFRADSLVLHVERDSPQCQRPLPIKKTAHITVSNLYWPRTSSYLLKITVPQNAARRHNLLPPAQCLNTSVRAAPNNVSCPQFIVEEKVAEAISGDSAWMQCVPADSDFATDILQVLPHSASGSGALREELTYAYSAPANAVEVVQLLPGARVCVNRDYSLVPGSPTAWATSHLCTELLNALDAKGRVVLSRTDTGHTFPYASDLYKDDGKVHEARSWLAVRAALALDMPHGAFMYVYYSGYGMHNKPPATQEESPWSLEQAGRIYPTGEVTPPVPLTPILLAHTKRLKLEGSEPPTLEALCQGSDDKDKKHCFAFPDFSFVDVLRPFSVDGRVLFAPSGTLTSDVPEIRLLFPANATRIFRGRAVPIAFDVTKQQNAIPIAAGDRFGGQP